MVTIINYLSEAYILAGVRWYKKCIRILAGCHSEEMISFQLLYATPGTVEHSCLLIMSMHDNEKKMTSSG